MRTILVLGASGGIGNVATKTLLDEGYNIIGTYHQHLDTLAQIPAHNFQKIQLDLRSFESVKEAKRKILDISQHLYAVVNCAGIVQFEGENIQKDIEIWNETIGVNLTGNYLLAKYLQDIVEENGRFIMISSTDAYFGGAITVSYAASKSGVNSLTKSLSLMMRNKKVRVNTIAPGWVETAMIEGNGDEFLKKVAEINPLKRNAKPIDIANVISFLLSEKSEYINGQVLAVEGGYTNQDPTLLLEEEIQ